MSRIIANKLGQPDWPGWQVGGLYWRLAISYFLVTLVSVLTIQGAVALRPILEDYQQVKSDLHFDQMLDKQAAQQITPYLDQAVPDHPDYSALSNRALLPMLTALGTYAASPASFMAVLDGDGNPLAAASCNEVAGSPGTQISGMNIICSADTTGVAGTFMESPQIKSAIHAALVDKRLSASPSIALANSTWQGDAFAVVPIRAGSGRTLGAVVQVLRAPVSFYAPVTGGRTSGFFIDFVSEFLRRLDPVGTYFVVLASILGTLTGLLISRNLTRRLRRITRAADAWSRGELAVSVRDTSHDELGQLSRDLNRMAAQLQTLLTTRQELAVVEERNRLARELHDTVKQHVFANALLVRAARKQLPVDQRRAEKYLVDAEDLAEQAQQELVQLIRALRPVALAGKGLASMLREYVDDWMRRMGIQADLRIQGERSTPLDVEETLFRVAQEALANVARHSKARNVIIQLQWLEEWKNGENEEEGEKAKNNELVVLLSISDDGQGFNMAHTWSQGLGLISMRERVDAAHGSLTISSSSAGTSIQVRIPLLVEAASVTTTGSTAASAASSGNGAAGEIS